MSDITTTDTTVTFDITFGPAHEAVRLFTDVANDTNVPDPLRERARAVLKAWTESLATPAQLAAARDCLQINDELELDDEGVCVSVGADGFFIQTWSWVPAPEDEDEDEDDPDYDDDGNLRPGCGHGAQQP